GSCTPPTTTRRPSSSNRRRPPLRAPPPPRPRPTTTVRAPPTTRAHKERHHAQVVREALDAHSRRADGRGHADLDRQRVRSSDPDQVLEPARTLHRTIRPRR